MERKNNRGTESLIALFLFWLFGLLVGISLGAFNPWFAIFGIFSLVASFMVMPKKTETVITEEVKEDMEDVTK